MGKRMLLAILSVLLVAGPASAAYIDMAQSKTGSGYVISSSVTTSDYLRTPAYGWQLMSFTKGSAFAATVYVCETDTYAAGTCTSVATLSATDPQIEIKTGRRWILIDVTTAETGSNVSYITIQSNRDNAGGGGGSGGAPLAEYAALSSIDETTVSHVTLSDCDDLTCASPGTGSTHVPFYYNGSSWVPFPGAASGIASVQADGSPTLGGNLDGGDFDVTNLNSIGERNFYADSKDELDQAEDQCGQDMGGASPTGCHIWYTGPDFEINSSLEWFGTGGEATGNNSVHIHGMGGGLTGNNVDDSGTVIHWNNATGAPMVLLGACVQCSIDGFLFDGNGQATAGIKAADNAGPIVGLDVHHNGFYNIVGYAVETMDGGTTAGQGQWDTSTFRQNTIRHSLGCYKSNNAQSIGMTWGPDNTCTWMNGTGPYIDLAYGSLTYQKNYMGLTIDNATGIRVGQYANLLDANGFNQFELPSHGGDGVTAADASIDGVKVIECEATANGQTGKVLIDGAQFVSNSGTNKAFVCEKRGAIQWTNVNWSNTGANDNSAALTVEITRDDGFDTNALTVLEGGNFKNMGHADYAGLDYPEPWVPTYTNDPDIMRPHYIAANSPNTCRIGDLWVDSDNGNVATCYPANAWVTPFGDITTIGDCTTGACFEGAGSESTIKGIGNILMDLDDDNNTSNSHFYVRTGGNGAVLDVDELGNALASGSFYSPSIQGSTDVLVGEDSSTTGTLHFFHADGGAQTMVMPAGSGVLAYTLPADDGASGEQLQTNGSGVLTWEAAGGVASGDGILFDSVAVTASNGANFVADAGFYIDASGVGDPLDAIFGFDYGIGYNTVLTPLRCVFSDQGTGFGGFTCEGTTANSTEFKLSFPTYTDSGSDAEKFFVMADSSQTLTEKTFNAESSGNVLTTVEKLWFPAAGCNNATPTPFYDLPTSSAAEAGCITGTNTQKGTLDFDQTVAEYAQVTHLLPGDWTGTVDVKIKWLTTYTSSSVAWNVATSCVADAETDDPAFNTASSVVDATKGTTNQTNDATITGLTVTGCAAGELLHIQVSRDPTNGSDATLADARLIGFELTYRREI